MKKLLTKKFRERESKINRKLAGKKAEATRKYNQRLKQVLNIEES
jgi:hypothetical protein